MHAAAASRGHTCILAQLFSSLPRFVGMMHSHHNCDAWYCSLGRIVTLAKSPISDVPVSILTGFVQFCHNSLLLSCALHKIS